MPARCRLLSQSDSLNEPLHSLFLGPAVTTLLSLAYVVIPGPGGIFGKISATGTGLANYAITYVNGSLAITPATLTITGDTSSIVYTADEQVNGYSVEGLLGTDSIDSVLGVASATDAGTYFDDLFGATGTGLDNYAVTYVNGSLAITPAALTVVYTADSLQVAYGETPSNLRGTYSATGLLGDDRH